MNRPRASAFLAFSTVIVAIPSLSGSLQAQNTPPLPATGSVTIPLGEYDKMVELAAQPPKKLDTPPFPYVVKSAELTLHVNGELVSGSVVLDGEVLAKGDRKVPLVAGMTILDARQKGRDLPIEQEGGVHTALLPGPSEFSVTLDAALPLTIETGRASFSLPVPMAGASRLILSVAGDQTLVNVSPGLITSRSWLNGLTTIEATLLPGQTTNIWWASRLSAPAATVAPREVRFLSDIKTLISVSEAELAIAALAEVTVIQGEPAQFIVQAPEGYELTGATGPSLLSSDSQGESIVLKVSDAAARTHQFLLSLTKAVTGTTADVPLVSFEGAQRETGEVLIEGDGAIELTTTERGGLRRMDLRETNPYLRSLSRAALQSAFRYQKRPAEMPGLALAWVRFPDSRVLSAVAQQAVVTTLVTGEGRSLTEVKLTLKNQAQPFLKVDLPAGATILSAEVAGEKVKPVQGTDGSRVPLLRAGFRPTDSYGISFVFLHAGAPFAKKGGAELSLPKMDVPIGQVQWEVFLPQQYKVADFGGDAISERLIPPPGEDVAEELPSVTNPVASFVRVNLDSLAPSQVGGIVTDPTGAVIAGAIVEVVHLATGVTQTVAADAAGGWLVSNVPSGSIRITVQSLGFQSSVRQINHDANRGSRLNISLNVGAQTQTVTVEESAATTRELPLNGRNFTALQERAASSNVADLQRRVVGVLPIAVNVPRSGNAYRFVRPLVVDEETTLTFRYRSK